MRREFGLHGYTGPGASASNLGNISSYTVGYRYNPFMTSRAGFAYHNEYNWLHQDGTSPSATNMNTSELLLGFDFDFYRMDPRANDLQMMFARFESVIRMLTMNNLKRVIFSRDSAFRSRGRISITRAQDAPDVGPIRPRQGYGEPHRQYHRPFRRRQVDYRRYCAGCHGD